MKAYRRPCARSPSTLAQRLRVHSDSMIDHDPGGWGYGCSQLAEQPFPLRVQLLTAPRVSHASWMSSASAAFYLLSFFY
jgi:hypothetical protein